MTVEALSTNQAQSWFRTEGEDRRPAHRPDPAEARLPDDAGENWRTPISASLPIIPRVFPGL